MPDKEWSARSMEYLKYETVYEESSSLAMNIPIAELSSALRLRLCAQGRLIGNDLKIEKVPYAPSMVGVDIAALTEREIIRRNALRNIWRQHLISRKVNRLKSGLYYLMFLVFIYYFIFPALRQFIESVK